MKKRILYRVGLPLLILAALEVIFRLAGYGPDSVIHQSGLWWNSDGFMVEDKVHGWQLKIGHHYHGLDGKMSFESTVNAEGNRVCQSLPAVCETHPDSAYHRSIHFYGCEWTYGVGITDSQHLAAHFQKLLPNHCIRNKAVPGFGLPQIYLSLLEDINRGQKPSVAVINYASTQDPRTYPAHQWQSNLKHASANPTLALPSTIRLPFAKTAGDSLSIAYLSIQDMAGNLPLGGFSAALNWVASKFGQGNDWLDKEETESLNLRMLNMIADLCERRNVPVLFFGLDADTTPKLAKISSDWAQVANSSFNINDAQYIVKQGNAHFPNALAHSIYATEILEVMYRTGFVKAKDRKRLVGCLETDYQTVRK